MFDAGPVKHRLLLDALEFRAAEILRVKKNVIVGVMIIVSESRGGFPAVSAHFK